MSENIPLTLGQHAVGIKFNPDENPAVKDIKERFASLIDDVINFHQLNLDAINNSDPYLTNTIQGESLRTMMDAQMWAIKYVTWKP